MKGFFFSRLACTCEETCESVWPPNVSLYATSTRPLETTCRSVWPRLKSGFQLSVAKPKTRVISLVNYKGHCRQYGGPVKPRSNRPVFPWFALTSASKQVFMQKTTNMNMSSAFKLIVLQITTHFHMKGFE